MLYEVITGFVLKYFVLLGKQKIMKNLISLAATAIAFLCIAGNLNAQENSVIPTERYILIA